MYFAQLAHELMFYLPKRDPGKARLVAEELALSDMDGAQEVARRIEATLGDTVSHPAAA